MTSPEQFRAALAAVDLPVEWQIDVAIRPQRRCLNLQVNPDGSVLVLAPPALDPRLVTWFVESKRRWLTEKVNAATALAPAHPVRAFADVEEFDLLGASYRLQLVDRAPAGVGHLPVFAPNGVLYVRQQQPEQVRRAIIALYRQVGLEWVKRHGRQYEMDGQIFDLTYNVRDLGKHHWGLYYRRPRHSVAVHWAVFCMQPRFVEYVLAHEMAHATEPEGRSHGPAWQQRMRRWMPDWRQRQSELAEVGRHVWLGSWHRSA